jgi:hypothetical protein
MKDLIKQLREQRMTWVELEPGKEVRTIRPTEVDLVSHFSKGKSLSMGFEEAAKYVVDWRGITEADLLGSAVGSADPVPFTKELWAEVAADKLDWVNTVVQSLVKQLVERKEAQDQDSKN